MVAHTNRNLNIRISTNLLNEIDKAARINRLSKSVWIREVLADRIEADLEDLIPERDVDPYSRR